MKAIKGGLCLALALALTGCVSGNLEITEKDILEVARDDANATKSECQNVTIEKDGSHYNVSFDTANGSYTYKIGTNGIIQDRSYTKSENAEEETATVSTTTEKEIKKKETKKEEETTEEESKEESTSSFDDNQQQAINAVLGNMGMVESDVTNLTCTLSADGTQYEVTCNTGDYNITSIVDAASFTVLSTAMS